MTHDIPQDIIEDLFSSKEYVLKTIHEAREVFSSTNQKKWDAAAKALGLALIYCPDDMYTSVQATLSELNTRESYMRLRGIK